MKIFKTIGWGLIGIAVLMMFLLTLFQPYQLLDAKQYSNSSTYEENSTWWHNSIV